MAQIDDQLALYTQASKSRTIEFQYAFDEDSLGRTTFYLQAQMTGKTYIVSKTILVPTSGGLGTLLPLEEPEE